MKIDDKMAAGNQREIEKIKAKFDAVYRSNLPVCETCKSTDQVIPCVPGKPSRELYLYAEAGFAELQGCVIQPDWPIAKCKKCDKYIHQAD